MKKLSSLVIPLSVIGLTAVAVSISTGQAPVANPEASRIVRGYQIAPVPLRLRVRNRDLVGLGSYIVNAQGGCNDCHTNPPFAPGGDPYRGERTRINAARYLAGGTSFGPIVSANITPDDEGRPAGLTFSEFKTVMRTGHEPGSAGILQVMPWPIFKNMLERDLLAIYEYLSAIPSLPPHEEE